MLRPCFPGFTKFRGVVQNCPFPRATLLFPGGLLCIVSVCRSSQSRSYPTHRASDGAPHRPPDRCASHQARLYAKFRGPACPHIFAVAMEDVVPSVTVKDMLACQYSAWRHLFRHSPRCLPRSVIIPLPPAFVDYLHKDGVILPRPPPEVPLSCHDPRFDATGADSPVSWASSADGEAADDAGEGARSSSSDEEEEVVVTRAVRCARMVSTSCACYPCDRCRCFHVWRPTSPVPLRSWVLCSPN